MVDNWDLHAFACKMAPSRITRHHALNDIISRAFASAQNSSHEGTFWSLGAGLLVVII